MQSPPPLAFMSHASEDKERFVLGFATALRGKGVDVWLDQWEIAAGDSLIERVFTHGIDRAEVFIVVLSDVSVNKPWVRDELDAGAVRRIQGRTKIIPVLLDNVAVPPALEHLRYVSVPSLGLDGAVADVQASIFGVDLRPPLGNVPNYTTRVRTLVQDPTDDAVLNAVVDMLLEEDSSAISASDLVARLQGSGLNLSLVEDAIESLRTQRKIKTWDSLAETSITGVSGKVWLEAMSARGMDVEDLRSRLLAHIVNHESVAGFDAGSPTTLDSLLESLERNQLVKIHGRTFGGPIVGATVAGKRAVREI